MTRVKLQLQEKEMMIRSCTKNLTKAKPQHWLSGMIYSVDNSGVHMIGCSVLYM